MFAYLIDTEGTHHILLEQYEHYWVVDQTKQQMLLVEIFACLLNFEGTHYIPLQQQEAYDNNYTWIEMFRNDLFLINSAQADMFVCLWFEMLK